MLKCRMKIENLMNIVMNVDLADQTSRREVKVKAVEPEKKVCLDARVSSGFTRRNDFWGKRDYFFPCLLFLVHRGVVCYKKAGRSPDTHH